MQLLEIGLGESAIERRIRAGRLHVLHPKVYAVGHRLVPREGRWLAAVLRVGDGAVLSHGSAAELWGIRRPGRHGPVDVSAPRKSRSSATVRRHYLDLNDEEITARRGIPVTTLARTLFDIAAQASGEDFEGAIREAEYVHRFNVERLKELVDKHPGRRGAKTIKACLYRLGRGPQGRTRSKLEDRFASLLARTELPKPQLNVLLDLDGFKVEADCLWREQRLIIELDGGQSHRTLVAFETDRERDRRLQVAGWRVIRITWSQLDRPAVLLRDLGHLLSLESASTVA